jgi:two-component system nitrogen regulation sensor histidine kinase NtrY
MSDDSERAGERTFSLEGKLAAVVISSIVVTAALAALFFQITTSIWLAVLFAVAIAVPLSLWLLRWFMRPVNRVIQALVGGVASLRDNDFSISIANTRRDELGDLVAVYNELGGILRDERQDLFQRELLLDTIIQSTPLALVLTNSRGTIVYSNGAARQLFGSGPKLEGRKFEECLDGMPEPMREAIGRFTDGLIAVEGNVETETYHLSQRRFVLNAQDHYLYLVKRLTREINRQEVAIWKKVIRVIGHELNNSLAPISSLAHSGSLVVERSDPETLQRIFSTIEERASHLKDFIDSYARFAKLPSPQCEDVAWTAFIDSLRHTFSFSVDGPLPEAPGWFDPVQLEQVLINLLKNAHESGSDASDVSLRITLERGQQRLFVRDRGDGMSETVLGNALLPFYSTKQSGSGLGLSLCREIVEAHGGQLRLNNLNEGGLLVEVCLPAAQSGVAV